MPGFRNMGSTLRFTADFLKKAEKRGFMIFLLCFFWLTAPEKTVTAQERATPAEKRAPADAPAAKPVKNVFSWQKTLVKYVPGVTEKSLELFDTYAATGTAAQKRKALEQAHFLLEECFQTSRPSAKEEEKMLRLTETLPKALEFLVELRASKGAEDSVFAALVVTEGENMLRNLETLSEMGLGGVPTRDVIYLAGNRIYHPEGITDLEIKAGKHPAVTDLLDAAVQIQMERDLAREPEEVQEKFWDDVMTEDRQEMLNTARRYRRESHLDVLLSLAQIMREQELRQRMLAEKAGAEEPAKAKAGGKYDPFTDQENWMAYTINLKQKDLEKLEKQLASQKPQDNEDAMKVLRRQWKFVVYPEDTLPENLIRQQKRLANLKATKNWRKSPVAQEIVKLGEIYVDVAKKWVSTGLLNTLPADHYNILCGETGAFNLSPQRESRGRSQHLLRGYMPSRNNSRMADRDEVFHAYVSSVYSENCAQFYGIQPGTKQYEKAQNTKIGDLYNPANRKKVMDEVAKWNNAPERLIDLVDFLAWRKEQGKNLNAVAEFEDSRIDILRYFPEAENGPRPLVPKKK